MKKTKKLFCEKSKWEIMRDYYKENAMIGRFYAWLKEKYVNKSTSKKRD